MGRRRAQGQAGVKKTKEDRIQKANEIKEQLKKYQRIYVLRFSSSSSSPFNEIRLHFRSSVLCNAKKSIIEHAIGLNPQEETLPGLSGLLQYLAGDTAIFMTNEPHEAVESFMKSLTYNEFATAGFIANTTFVVPQGELDSTMFNYSMDGYLRELGLPVQLDNGRLINVRDYTVCVEGQPLTKNSAQLLQHFNQRLATFEVVPVAFWQGGQIFTPQ